MRLPYGICIFDDPPRSVEKLREVFECLDLDLVCTVGDIVTRNVIKYWRVPDVAVVDQATGLRHMVEPLQEDLFSERFTLVNERSTISTDAEYVLQRVVDLARTGRKVLVHVIGEEDLLAIILVLTCRRCLVVYGNYFLKCIVAIPSLEPYRRAVLKLYAQFRHHEETTRSSGSCCQPRW